ncbi:MAG: dienelactone hydrolase family protein [Chloroflexi bacterium]|nr:dienelactone hydrolase family protein [Chloroflexota bacterium]
MNSLSPTLGNLYPFVSAIADQNQPALSFLNPNFNDPATWSGQARTRLLELLCYQPPCVPLAPEIVEVTDCGDHIREKVYFNSAPASRIPAYLLRPKPSRAPAPAIVALHDHGGFYRYGKGKLVEMEGESPDLTAFKREYYSGRSYATELARHGYVVIVTDAFYFGERRIDFTTIDPELHTRLQSRISTLNEQVDAYHEQCSAFEEVVARHIIAAGATWLGVLSHDDRTSVDYLVTRPEVDPTRIGCLGLSMGGHRTDYLVATDPRIKAAVSIGWMTHWRDLLPHHVRSHSWAQFLPGLASNFELSDVISIGMPAALFVQECAQDMLFTKEGMQRACEKIEQVYAKANLATHYQYRFYDVPHQFNAAMQEDAFAWLDRWLT